MAHLAFLNKKHEQKRVTLGKSARVVDLSMQAVRHAVDDKEPAQGAVDEDAWEDLTDWQNEDFVYVF